MNNNQAMKEFLREKISIDVITKYIFIKSMEEKYDDEYLDRMYRINCRNIRERYSVTAGICMAGAVFLFLTAKNANKPSIFFRRNLIPLLLVVLSFLIRTKVCIMLLPFLLLAGLMRWCGEEYIFTAVNFRKYLMLVGTAILGMAAAYCVDLVAYQGSEWSSFRSFFDARTKL